jgi:tetratricopeptide (TPR) repeat protein
MKKYDKATEFYGPKYIEKFMGDANKLASYANFWGGQGNNLESALQAAKKSVDLAPGVPSNWGALAIVCQKMKKNDDALKAGEKAVELAPENQKMYYKNRLESLKKSMETK